MAFNRATWLKNGKRWKTPVKSRRGETRRLYKARGAHSWTAERWRMVNDLRVAGKTETDIAHALGVTRQTLSMARIRHRKVEDDADLALPPVPPAILAPWPKSAIFTNITRAEARLVRECCKRGSV